MLKNILLLSCTILLTLFLLEGAIRVIGYERLTIAPLTGFHEYDDKLGWKLLPNYDSRFAHRDFNVEVRTNSVGFRDDEFEGQKRNNTKRVVSLGDSFTWGWGVENEEVYMQIAENLLDNVEIINMGQNGYSTGQELLLLEKFKNDLAPDLVTVGFFANDLTENVEGRGKPLFRFVDGDLEITKVTGYKGLELQIKSFFVKNSYLFVLVNYAYARLTLWLDSLLSPESEIHINNNSYERYIKSIDANWGQKWRVFEQIILRMKAESNNELLIIYIPYREQVENDSDTYIELTRDDRYDIDLPNAILRKLAEKHHIYFMDLTPLFRMEYASGKQLYFPHDGHMSRLGHQVAGETLAAELRKIFLEQQ